MSDLLFRLDLTASAEVTKAPTSSTEPAESGEQEVTK